MKTSRRIVAFTMALVLSFFPLSSRISALTTEFSRQNEDSLGRSDGADSASQAVPSDSLQQSDVLTTESPATREAPQPENYAAADNIYVTLSNTWVDDPNRQVYLLTLTNSTSKTQDIDISLQNNSSGYWYLRKNNINDNTSTNGPKLTAGVTVQREVYLDNNAPADTYSIKVVVTDLSNILSYNYFITQTVGVVLQSQAPPEGLTASPPAGSGQNGFILGTTTAMEYRIAGSLDKYFACEALHTEVAPGTYEVRMAGTVTHAPSEAVTVTVSPYTAPVLQITPEPGAFTLPANRYLSDTPNNLVVSVVNSTSGELPFTATLVESQAFTIFKSVATSQNYVAVLTDYNTLPSAYIGSVTVTLPAQTPVRAEPYTARLQVTVGEQLFEYTVSQSVAKGLQTFDATLTGLAPAATGTEGGGISGTTTDMEYRPGTTGQYASCINGITPVPQSDALYTVRLKETANLLASDDVTVYVPADLRYTVVYDLGGGTGDAQPVSQLISKSIALHDGQGLTLIGHSFVGWRKGTGAFYQPGATFSHDLAETVRLYAQWQENDPGPDPNPDPGVDPDPAPDPNPDPGIDPDPAPNPNPGYENSILIPAGNGRIPLTRDLYVSPDSPLAKSAESLFFLDNSVELSMTRGSTEANFSALDGLYTANRDVPVEVRTTNVTYRMPQGAMSSRTGFLHDFGAELYDTESFSARQALAQTDNPDAVVVRLYSETLPVIFPIEVTYDIGSWYRKKNIRVYRLGADGKLEFLCEVQADDNGLVSVLQRDGGTFLFVPEMP